MSAADRYLRTLENHNDSMASTPKKISFSPSKSPSKTPAKSPFKSPTRSPKRDNTALPPKMASLSTPKSPQRSPMRTTLPVVTPTQNKERKKLLISENGPSIDQERRDLQAYEYLCHVGEAHEWMAGILGKETMPLQVADLPTQLVDGVLLARIAKHFRPDLVPKIFEHKRLQYRHTDNIVYFMDFLASVKMPSLFLFDITDLYERRNLPKVIFCIHALSHILKEMNLALEMENLVGKLNFTEDQLNDAQRGLDAAGMRAPNFNKVTRHFSGKQDQRPPQPQFTEPEPEEEPVAVLREPVVPERIPTPESSFQISEEELLLIELEATEDTIIALQSISRGSLARRRYNTRAPQPRTEHFVSQVQACIRSRATRKAIQDKCKAADVQPLSNLQSVIRANKVRDEFDTRVIRLSQCENNIIAIQSIIRGRFARSSNKHTATGHKSLDTLQAACRGILLRRKIAAIDSHFKVNSGLILELQMAARAYLSRQRFSRHRSLMAGNQSHWTALQANIRGFLLRKRLADQQDKLQEARNSIVKVQSAFRGLLQRFEIGCVYDDLDDQIVGVVGLQAMARGALTRRKFVDAVEGWYANVDKIVKLQSMWRTRTQIGAYNSLIADPNPSLSTIKHFIHLLNDNEADYQEEINLEVARKHLKEQVKSNEQLEHYIDQMDTKIALLLRNKISLDEVIQHRDVGAPTLLRRRSSAALRQQQQKSIDSINGPQKPLDLKALNKNSRKRLELYQGLFYILQTQPQYLARFINNLSHGQVCSERDAKRTSDFIMTIFGGLSGDREEYFFLQLLSKTIYLELDNMNVPEMSQQSLVWRLYGAMNKRRSVHKALQNTMEHVIDRIIAIPGCDLESDPLAIYHQFATMDEMNGHRGYYNHDITVEYAIKEPRTRAKFVANLQLLRELVVEVITALEEGVSRMPYHTRYLAHQAFMHGCRKYDNHIGFNSMSLVGTVFIKQFLVPAMQASDSYGITETALDMQQINNINSVANVLSTAAQYSVFGDDNPYLQPLNEFVKACSVRLTAVFKKLIDIPDLQTMFGMTNFDDVKNHTRPTLSIKTEEILGIHSLVFENMDILAEAGDNCIRPVLRQLGPLPNDARDILDIARFTQVRLDLNPNYGTPSMQSDSTDTAGLMTLVKRCLIYVLRVQKGENLMRVLVEPVEQRQEEIYATILDEDQSSVGAEKPGELANLTYRELKLLTLEKVLELESSGRISRDNDYQELINSLANDIRNKHELRQARRSELRTCNETFRSLQEKEVHLKTTRNTYNNYIETAMTTLQEQSQEKNKKKSVFPFSRKFFQQRDLLKSGRRARFGSYRYTASSAIEKGILINVKGYSERQYRDLTLTFSCDTVAHFNVEVAYKGILLPNATATITLDQLLEYQYEDRESFDMFDDVVRFHTTRLLNFIFRKFYGAE